MTDRIPCLVPFCRRTAKREDVRDQEIICGQHWRMVPALTRRRYMRVRRQLQMLIAKHPHTLPIELVPRAQKLIIVQGHMWDRIKRQAIEAAGGIG